MPMHFTDITDSDVQRLRIVARRAGYTPSGELRDIHNATWKGLHEARSGLHKAARQVLSQIEAMPTDAEIDAVAQEERQHDVIMALIDAIDGEFRDRANQPDKDKPSSFAKRPYVSGAVALPPIDGESAEDHEARQRAANEELRGVTTPARTEWRDSAGNRVRVLKPEERWCERRHDGPTVGDLVRAMIDGPRDDVEKRVLSEGTNTAGGYTVPTPLADYFIDKLRAESICIKAGAQTVKMTANTLSIARLDGDPTAAWVAENGAVPANDATFGRVLFTAQKLAVLVKLSRELLEDSVNVGAMIDKAFAQSMALELDRVCLFGSGTAPEPRGVANVVGINSTSMGTNGAQLMSFDPFIDAIYEIKVDNAGEPTAAIFHPRTWQTMAKLKDGQGQPLRQPDDVAKLPKLSTTAVPITETQGTAAGICSSIITGNFAHMLIGMRTELEIIRADNVFVANDQIAFLARLRADMQLAHVEGFNRTVGIKP